jgi:hypothetical protein
MELSQKKKSKWLKITHEEVLNIPGHKRNAIKTTLRFHLTPVRMSIIKNTTTNVGVDVEKKNPHTLLVEM